MRGEAVDIEPLANPSSWFEPRLSGAIARRFSSSRTLPIVF